MTRYPLLFQPGRIGRLALPNRIVMAPMGTGYADEQGHVTDRLIAYHVARAQGGVGLSIVEHTAVRRDGLAGPTMLALYDDEHVPGFRRLCDAVHAAGGRIAVQLNHGGRQADPSLAGELVAPSEHPSPSGKAFARALTTEEVGEIVAAYAAAAARAHEAGADGVEVHLAHGYLGCSFLSPLTNRRTDRYGGDTDRRCQFAREVFTEIRRHCGDDFSVWCRLSADEFVPGGMTLDEARRVAPLLQQAGAQAIHVSGCVGETANLAAACYYDPPLNLAHLADGVKAVVDVPVIAVGKVLTPDLAEGLLARGACDFVALGRPLLADPDWPAKARAGRPEDICPCIACNIGCLHRRMPPAGICFCVTNPRTGREHEWPALSRTASPQRALVIGAGPAGMSAASALAEVGYDVELWEAESELGGAFRRACAAPGKELLRTFLDYQVRRLAQTSVRVRLGREGTVESIAEHAPDVVILASGAASPRPEAFGPRALTAEAVYRDPSLAHGRVAVIGGGRRGVETAHLLAERGSAVTLIEAGTSVGSCIPSGPRAFVLGKLAALGVRVCCGVEALSGSEAGVVGREVGSGAEVLIEADTISLALPRASGSPLAEALKAADCPNVHVIGDAREPRSAQEAVYEGARCAHLIFDEGS
ncbi:MAG: FAD-binding protein [Armatimonadetes bacterium]|nr:FAD-binding protein [Armatimonadota bacterium]